MSGFLEPMRAVAGDQPIDDGWRYEIKWDGIRALCRIADGTVTTYSSNGNDISPSFPELDDLGRTIGVGSTMLDGELVTFDQREQRPSFGRLQRRLHHKPSIALRIENPVIYMVFDLLVLDGNDIRRLDFDTRRSALEAVLEDGESWLLTHVDRDGDALWADTVERDLEGIISKRSTSRYRSGVRSTDWVKTKRIRREEFVAIGFTLTTTTASGFASLVIATRFDGELEYCGRVGTGFDETARRNIQPRLDSYADPSRPGWAVSEPDAVWLQSPFVIEVAYLEMTDSGRLRQPVFVGLRDDKSPRDVAFEGRRKGEVA
ncbi:MAG: non-homologous end-joining DNA ligase [Acidobacteria bacterium]|nr:non-homologous end-joining DNA ligase [Acidobacteriota bacterium]